MVYVLLLLAAVLALAAVVLWWLSTRDSGGASSGARGKSPRTTTAGRGGSSRRGGWKKARAGAAPGPVKHGGSLGFTRGLAGATDDEDAAGAIGAPALPGVATWRHGVASGALLSEAFGPRMSSGVTPSPARARGTASAQAAEAGRDLPDAEGQTEQYPGAQAPAEQSRGEQGPDAAASGFSRATENAPEAGARGGVRIGAEPATERVTLKVIDRSVGQWQGRAAEIVVVDGARGEGSTGDVIVAVHRGAASDVAVEVVPGVSGAEVFSSHADVIYRSVDERLLSHLDALPEPIDVAWVEQDFAAAALAPEVVDKGDAAVETELPTVFAWLQRLADIMRVLPPAGADETYADYEAASASASAVSFGSATAECPREETNEHEETNEREEDVSTTIEEDSESTARVLAFPGAVAGGAAAAAGAEVPRSVGEDPTDADADTVADADATDQADVDDQDDDAPSETEDDAESALSAEAVRPEEFIAVPSDAPRPSRTTPRESRDTRSNATATAARLGETSALPALGESEPRRGRVPFVKHEEGEAVAPRRVRHRHRRLAAGDAAGSAGAGVAATSGAFSPWREEPGSNPDLTETTVLWIPPELMEDDVQ